MKRLNYYQAHKNKKPKANKKNSKIDYEIIKVRNGEYDLYLVCLKD